MYHERIDDPLWGKSVYEAVSGPFSDLWQSNDYRNPARLNEENTRLFYEHPERFIAQFAECSFSTFVAAKISPSRKINIPDQAGSLYNNWSPLPLSFVINVTYLPGDRTEWPDSVKVQGGALIDGGKKLVIVEARDKSLHTYCKTMMVIGPEGWLASYLKSPTRTGSELRAIISECAEYSATADPKTLLR